MFLALSDILKISKIVNHKNNKNIYVFPFLTSDSDLDNDAFILNKT